MLRFTVYGEPQPQGSTKAFAHPLRNRVTGAAIVDKFNRPVYGARTVSDNPKNKGWRQLVAEGANRALAALPAADRGLLQGGVRVTIAFYLPRPKSLPKRATAHTKKPDVDKLTRSCFDALSQVVFTDDSQVCELVVGKFYAAIDDAPHADITVEATIGLRAIDVPAVPLSLFGEAAHV